MAPLADCPYCAGEGTDAETALGLCRRCYGTGRVARFLAERTLKRWARAADGPDDDEIEDEVPAGYDKTRPGGRRGSAGAGPWSRRP
jgi:hypothetical protein